MLFATHDIEVAWKVGDQIAVLPQRRIVVDAPAHYVIASLEMCVSKILIDVVSGSSSNLT